MSIHRYRTLEPGKEPCGVTGCSQHAGYGPVDGGLRLCSDCMESVQAVARLNGDTVEIESAHAGVAVEPVTGDRSPCPFCLKTQLAMVRTLRGDGVYWLKCLNCGASGPASDYRDEACSLWDEWDE